jgi:hypothetical protein
LTALPVIALAFLGMGVETSAGATDARPAWGPRPSLAAAGDEEAGAALDPVKGALKDGGYPWYDPDADRVRPVWTPQHSWLKWIGDRVERAFKAIDEFLKRLNLGGGWGVKSVGDSIATILLVGGLVAVLMALVALWARRDAMAAFRRAGGGSRLGSAARLDQILEGTWPGSDDTWAEALRRRAAGDLAGAIVCLFAHQLLSLDQLGLIRLGPGRTARQYVSEVRDSELLDSVAATLHLFEDVYYGRQSPAVPAFDRVWNRAQTFEDRCRMLGGSR